MVLVASDSAIRGSHRIPAYSAVKAGVVAIAELLGAEGAAYGIRANAVCPGNTLPGMAGDDPARWRPTASGAFATAHDVAASVAFLASAEAAHINGATLAHRRRDGRRHAVRDPGLGALGRRGSRRGRGRRLLRGTRGLADRVLHDVLRIGRADRVRDLRDRVVVAAQRVVELALERRPRRPWPRGRACRPSARSWAAGSSRRPAG